MPAPLVRAKHVVVDYYSFGHYLRALNDVNFDIYSGETLGIVGESGAGKSTIGWALLGLIEPPSRITGSIEYEGAGNVLKLSEWKITAFRWKKVAMVFQSAMNGLDPLQTVGKSFIQLMIEKKMARTKEEATAKIITIFDRLNLGSGVLNMFPHELSGGMKQRVSIAMAISCHPDTLIADEPTTALDVVAQFSVTNMLKELISSGTVKTIVFITHDIAVQLIMADRIIVMFGGKIVEEGKKAEILDAPKHPYTKYLFRAFLNQPMDVPQGSDGHQESAGLMRPGISCPFASQCPAAMQKCYQGFPNPSDFSDTHRVYCYLYGE